jgi:hypothetical protein
MHNIEEIKKNQVEFYSEIVYFLKNDIKNAKVELTNLKPKSDEIKNLKENLQKKVNKFKLIPEIEKYFLTDKNLNPKFYVIWDNELKEAQIFKFTHEERT